MLWEWMARGAVLGLSIAAPVGPISILCIKKTVAGGFRIGLISGLGVATADAIYASIAGFGLTALSAVLMKYGAALQITGGLFICYLGLKSILASPRGESSEPAATTGKLRAYTVTLLLTLSNPMTILSFLGIFGGSGILLARDISAMPFLVGGIFIGSLLWWICLTGAASLLRLNVAKKNSKLYLFNKLSGLVMLLFGAAALVQAIIPLL